MAKGQGQLIETTPENQEAILVLAKQLKKIGMKKTALAEDEKICRASLIEAIKEADVQPMENGVYILKVDGMTITLTPKEEAVKIKENGDDAV